MHKKRFSSEVLPAPLPSASLRFGDSVSSGVVLAPAADQLRLAWWISSASLGRRSPPEPTHLPCASEVCLAWAFLLPVESAQRFQCHVVLACDSSQSKYCSYSVTATAIATESLNQRRQRYEVLTGLVGIVIAISQDRPQTPQFGGDCRLQPQRSWPSDQYICTSTTPYVQVGTVPTARAKIHCHF